MGLTLKYRLKKRCDFQAVYQQGIRRSSSILIVRALPIPLSSENLAIATKIGISISRKVSKKSVVRNRIKRQLRAVIRALLPKIETNWQIVIVVLPPAIECKYEHFLRELKQLLIEAEIIK